MRVELPYLVQDQLTSARKGMRAIESFRYEGDEYFLDGPVSRRIAILDFDETDGSLRDSVQFQPPDNRRKLGRYLISKNPVPSDRDFQRVSVFATILKTIRAFESKEVLGREINWAFDAPQLLVIPRAGKWANAYYERESHSLQFFYFDSMSQPGKEIFTSLSHDIVTHETGHAILDGIAPGLYDAITPQSLALHEGIADLTSLIMALESGVLRKTVLDQMDGRIDAPTAFSAVAEEFGQALGQGKVYLRSLWNDKTLNPADRSEDSNGEPNLVSRSLPHELSQVLTGALYKILVSLHEQQLDLITSGLDDPSEIKKARFSGSGKALAIATKIFRRLVFRCLDYLPPGEISFADFGRAIIAADRSSNPDSENLRRSVATEFVKRHIARSEEELTRQPVIVDTTLSDVDLDILVESDWAAYQFVEANRMKLGIPNSIPFRVLPRLAVEKTTWRGSGPASYREIILKVAWERHEENQVVGLNSKQRAVTVGLTLAIDRDNKSVKALLFTSEEKQQTQDRSSLLQQMVDDELIINGPGDSHGSTGIQARESGGVLRVRGSARSLHLTKDVC